MNTPSISADEINFDLLGVTSTTSDNDTNETVTLTEASPEQAPSPPPKIAEKDDAENSATPTDVGIAADRTVQDGLIGLCSTNRKVLSRFTGNVGIRPHLTYETGDKHYFFIKVDGLPDIHAGNLPAALQLILPGDTVPIADNISCNPTFDVNSIEGVSTAFAYAMAEPETTLSQYSVRGRSEEFRQKAVKTTPLLGRIAMNGQATVIFAAPNTGKTLITLALLQEAVSEGRILGNRVFYVNADDSSTGVADKMALTDDMGVEVLVPNENGFDPQSLGDLLDACVTNGDASGTVVIIDTLKKCTSVMDKKAVTRFTKSCREFTMAGGTIIALAHVNKKPGADGKPVYAGTSDLVDDFDAGYTLAEARPVEGDMRTGIRYVRFENIKRRGDNALQAAYAYSIQQGLSYDALVASVSEVEAESLDWWDAEQDAAENLMVETVEFTIRSGVVQKMEIARAAAKKAGCGRAKIIRLIDEMTDKLWAYEVRDRGAKVYHLITPAAE